MESVDIFSHLLLKTSVISDFTVATCDLTVLGKEEMYSKAQAEQILQNFFQKNPPRSFNLKQHASNPSASHYGIGTYTNTQNARFRIYFLLKKIGNQAFIQQFSIEPEN